MPSNLEALLKEEEFETHVAVLGLLSIGVAQWDVDAPVRGWGQEYLGHGIMVGNDQYSIGYATVQVEGEALSMINLCIRRNFFGDGSGAVENIYIPIEELRNVSFKLRTFAKDEIDAAASAA